MAMTSSRRVLVLVVFGVLSAAHRTDVVGAQEGSAVTITVTAKKYSFSPDRIEVGQGDLVKVTLVTEDIPHSFTVDAYRIAKRAAARHSVTFEFRADQPGTFPFYCNLEIDSGCRTMKGSLVVRKP